MTQFQANPAVIYQLGMDFVGYDTVCDALDDSDFDVDPAHSVAMVSIYGRMFELNLVSACIWELCRQGQASDLVASSIARRFDIDPAFAEKDVVQTFAEFEEFGLGVCK